MRRQLGLTPAMMAKGRRMAAADKSLDAASRDFHALGYALVARDGLPLEFALAAVAKAVTLAMAS